MSGENIRVRSGNVLYLMSFVSTIRGHRERIKELSNHGINCSFSVKIVLRRLPSSSFDPLMNLLKEISQEKGAFALIGLPPLPQILGVKERNVPGIKWADMFHSFPAEEREKRKAFFIREYFDSRTATLDLSPVQGFQELVTFMTDSRPRP